MVLPLARRWAAERGLVLAGPLDEHDIAQKEAGFRPRRCCLWGNYRRGLSGLNVLLPRCGCDGSEQSPCVVPSLRWEVEAPLPTWRHEELLGGVPYHFPPRGGCPAVSWADESSSCVAPPGGVAQAVEVVGDELEVPKMNGLTEGESTARQMFTVSGDGD
jgi:hypothetical protein